MIVNYETYPELHRAFRAVEEDCGGHLIGTVYPGNKLNLDEFTVPYEWEHLCAPAEAGLTRLRKEYGRSADSPGQREFTDWDVFVYGEQDEAEAVEKRQGDLAEARRLLNDYFNEWQSEDRPGFEGTTGHSV